MQIIFMVLNKFFKKLFGETNIKVSRDKKNNVGIECALILLNEKFNLVYLIINLVINNLVIIVI